MPRLGPNGHHSSQRFNGLITTSLQPDRTPGTCLANRLNMQPPHTTGTAAGMLQGHRPPPRPSGQDDTPGTALRARGQAQHCPFFPGAEGWDQAPGAPRCGRMGVALSSRAHLPCARLGLTAPTKSSGHRAGWQPGGTRRPIAQPWPRVERPVLGGEPPVGRELVTRPPKRGSGPARWLLNKPLARLPLTPDPSGGG